eukprot:2133452-Amphidinium_carterae.1
MPDNDDDDDHHHDDYDKDDDDDDDDHDHDHGADKSFMLDLGRRSGRGAFHCRAFADRDSVCH